MHEIDIRVTCGACLGEGGWLTNVPSAKSVYAPRMDGFVTPCYLCDGAGKVMPEIKTVGLQKDEAPQT